MAGGVIPEYHSKELHPRILYNCTYKPKENRRKNRQSSSLVTTEFVSLRQCWNDQHGSEASLITAASPATHVDIRFRGPRDSDVPSLLQMKESTLHGGSFPRRHTSQHLVPRLPVAFTCICTYRKYTSSVYQFISTDLNQFPFNFKCIYHQGVNRVRAIM